MGEDEPCRKSPPPPSCSPIIVLLIISVLFIVGVDEFSHAIPAPNNAELLVIIRFLLMDEMANHIILELILQKFQCVN